MTDTKDLAPKLAFALRSVEAVDVIHQLGIAGPVAFAERVGDVATRIPHERASQLDEALRNGLVELDPAVLSESTIQFRYQRVRLTDAGRALLHPEAQATTFAREQALHAVQTGEVVLDVDAEQFHEKVGDAATPMLDPYQAALTQLLKDGLVAESPFTRPRTAGIPFRYRRILITQDGVAVLNPGGETAKTIEALREFDLPKHPTATDIVDALGRQAYDLVISSGPGEVIAPHRFAILHVRAYTRLLDDFMTRLTDENPDLAASLRSAFAQQQDARVAAGEG